MTPFDAPEQELSPAEDETDPALEQVAGILSKYWLSPTHDEAKLLENVLDKEADWHKAFQMYGFYGMCRLAYNTYNGFSMGNQYGADFQTQMLRFSGEDGDQIDYCVNEIRSFWDQIFNMTTKNRPSFQSQATNDDAASVGQVEAADTLVKYYFEQVYGESKEKAVVKAEGTYGKSYTYLDWDSDGGPLVEVDVPVEGAEMLPVEQQTVKESVRAGRFKFYRLFPWQVACDPYRSEYDEHLYRIIQIDADRYEEIARYPAYAEALENTGDARCSWYEMFPSLSPKSNKERITKRIVLHAPCAVLPKGRRIVFVGEKMVDDGPLPIDEVPLVPYMTCELDGTSFGISDLWNLIPPQQMLNALLSDAASNVEMFGRPIVSMFSTGEPNVDELANGAMLVMLDNPESKPNVLQIEPITDSHIKLIEMQPQLMQALSGLNAISRGESDASVKSGTHAALYHSMAVENQAPRQAQLDLHRERVANLMIKFLKKYAIHKQTAQICGESERPYLEEFTKDDLSTIQRVVVKTASPMLRTTSGKLAIAETLRQWPGIQLTDPNEVIELITTGQVKPLYSAQRSALIRIRKENEALARGPAVQEIPGDIDPITGQEGPPKQQIQDPSIAVLFTDDVKQHLIHHLEVLNTAWGNDAVRKATLAHILEHLDVARNGDPFAAQILGIISGLSIMNGQDPNADKENGNGGAGLPPPPDEEAADDSLGASIPTAAKAPKSAQ